MKNQTLTQKSVLHVYLIIHKINERNFKQLRNTPVE